jgi:DNA-binding response OmpR family regulator
MPEILICAGASVVRDLEASPVHRDGFTRHVVGTAEAGILTAVKVKPALVVIDRDLARAETLVTQLRNRAETRSCAIVIVAPGDMNSEELGLLQAGANALLRLPPDPEWDTRIEQLLKVPTRKETRVPVSLTFETRFRTERVPGRVLNLSPTGMLVECTATLSVGSQVSFMFEMSGFETSTGEVVGRGRVVREAGRNHYAVLFTSIDEIGRELLRRFLLVP